MHLTFYPRSVPARPTNGLPSESSLAPGPSPIIIIFELILPSPKTKLLAFFLSSQFLIDSIFFFNLPNFSALVPLKEIVAEIF